MRVQPTVVGMAAFLRSSDVQFGNCRFHASTLASLCRGGQCHFMGLRLAFGYAAHQGTPTTALLCSNGHRVDNKGFSLLLGPISFTIR